jgi:hypothetical protein
MGVLERAPLLRLTFDSISYYPVPPANEDVFPPGCRASALIVINSAAIAEAKALITELHHRSTLFVR